MLDRRLVGIPAHMDDGFPICSRCSYVTSSKTDGCACIKNRWNRGYPIGYFVPKSLLHHER